MSKALQNLREALYATGLVQPLDSTGRGGSISVLCRQVPGQEKAWLGAVDELLASAENGGLDIHICRRYVRREGRMVFGWNLGVETPNAKGLVTAIDLLTTTLKKFHATYEDPAPAPAVAARPARRADDEADPLGTATVANRRTPESSEPDPVAPQGFRPSLKVVQRGVDKKGRATEVTEMPLPHVYQELNAPTKPGGRGARSITEDNE